jgi:hypothetical protein
MSSIPSSKKDTFVSFGCAKDLQSKNLPVLR